jgi:excisionase family DNA binding protein
MSIISNDRPTKGQLLDIHSAAERLDCSERYMRRLIQERRIPFIRLGGRKIRFLVVDLDRWVESQRVEVVQ